MRSIFALLLFFSMPLTAAADSLTVAVRANNPPFAAAADGGTLGGFNVDMTEALCEEMQASCTLLPLADNAALINALRDNTADMVIALPLPLVEEQGLLSSERYYKHGARFIRRKGDKGRISYKGLAGKRIAVVKDTVFAEFANKFSGAQIVLYDTVDSARASLLNQEADYVLGDRIKQLLWAKENEGFEVSGPNYSTARYFSSAVIAVRDEPLRERVNAAMQALRQKEIYQTLSKNYFTFDIYGR